MRAILAVSLVVLLSGCVDPGVKDADGKILCDPENGKAYIVEHRIAAVSKVAPLPYADEICPEVVNK